MTEPLQPPSAQNAIYNSSLQVLMQSRKWWTTGIILGMVMAVLATMFVSPKFEARALLQIGQIGGSGSIESPLNTVQRMKSLGFQHDVAQKIVAQSPEHEYPTILKELNKVSINSIKNTDLIEITLTARSKEEAIQRSQQYLNILEQRHKQLSEPLIKMRRDQLALAEQHVHEFENETIQAAQPSNKSFIDLAQLGKNDKLIFWQQQVMQLQQLITYPNTRPTGLAEAINVLDAPVFPKKPIFLLSGSMLGFALGLLSFILHKHTKALAA